jgi:hypothetical protein
MIDSPPSPFLSPHGYALVSVLCTRWLAQAKSALPSLFDHYTNGNPSQARSFCFPHTDFIPRPPQAALRHHHHLTDSLFHYPISSQIILRLDPAWPHVTGQPDSSSPAAEPDLSPNPAHDPTRLTNQLDPDAISPLPCLVHSVRPPHTTLNVLCPCSTVHKTTLPTSRSSSYALSFLLPPPRAWTKARMKLFHKIKTNSKSKSDLEKNFERFSFEL